MRRRRLLALLGSIPLAGCTGGPGDPITSLAVNKDDTSHTVAARIVRSGQTVIANTVTVEPNGIAELGTTPWRAGHYRVTARVGGELVVDTAFESDEWFNQLDVVIGADGSVGLNRGRAG
jgi:hypothetical protein